MRESQAVLSGFSPEALKQHREGMVLITVACQARLDRRLAELTSANAHDLWSDIEATLLRYRDTELAAQDLARARARYEEVTGRPAPTR